MIYINNSFGVARSLLITLAFLLSLAHSFFLHAQSDPAVETTAIELFNKGQDVHEKGDLISALGFYEKALALLPEFAEAELQRGNALMALGRLSDAEAAFRKAIGIKDDWSLAYSHLGNSLIRQNKFKEAKSALTKAIELDDANTPAWLASVELAIRTDATEVELRAIYQKIAPLSANAKPSIAVLAAKAELERMLKEDQAAARSAQKVLDLDPKNRSMLLVAADVSLRSNDVIKAEFVIKQIESNYPAAEELPLLKVRLMIASGKLEEADKFIGSMANPSEELQKIKQQLTPSTLADIPALEKELEKDPRSISTLSRLCSLYRKADPLLALDRCKRAADVEPGNIEHAIGFGAALIQAKQYPQATSLLRRLVLIAPENITIRANFATALFQQKLYTEAKEQFRWLTEKQPLSSVAYFFLAIAHDELGEFADALINYLAFVKLADPKVNQLEIDKVNLRLPALKRQLDSGKGRKNARSGVNPK